MRPENNAEQEEVKIRSFGVSCIVCGAQTHVIGVMSKRHMTNVRSEHLCVACANLKGRKERYAINL